MVSAPVRSLKGPQMPVPSKDMLNRSQPKDDAEQISVSTTKAQTAAGLSAGMYDIHNGTAVTVRFKLGTGTITLVATGGYPLPAGATMRNVYIDGTEMDDIAFITAAGTGTVDVIEVK